MAAGRRSRTILEISARTSSDFMLEAGLAVLHAWGLPPLKGRVIRVCHQLLTEST
jgi:hypothetical protein